MAYFLKTFVFLLFRASICFWIGTADTGYDDNTIQHNHEVHVITLDAQSDRYRNFLARNSHLKPQLHQWDAVDGRRTTYEDAIAEGIVTQALVDNKKAIPSLGAIGCAISHHRIWQYVAEKEETNEPVLILEDDAITHPHILDYGKNHAAELAAVDLTLCSHNGDAFLLTKNAQDAYILAVADPIFPTTAWIENALGSTDVESTRMERISHAWGTGCYWLSPEGARKLLLGKETKVLPLRNDYLFQRNPKRKGGWPPLDKTALLGFMVMFKKMVQSSIDSRLNRLYDSLEAYIVLPDLAYAPNEIETSATLHVDDRYRMSQGHPKGQEQQMMSREELRDLLRGLGKRPNTLSASSMTCMNGTSLGNEEEK